MHEAQAYQRLLRLLALAEARSLTPNRILRSGTEPATCTIRSGRKPRAAATEQLRGTDRNHKGVQA